MITDGTAAISATNAAIGGAAKTIDAEPRLITTGRAIRPACPLSAACHHV
jgi:hypothetical protein